MDQQMTTVNPFLNSKILRNVIRHLDTTGLFECRKVCRKWCELATLILLTEERIDDMKIYFDMPMVEDVQVQDMVQNCKTDTEEGTAKTLNGAMVVGDNVNVVIPKLKDYLDHVNSGSQLRFTNFSFENIKLNNARVQEFFQKCGTDVKRMKMLKTQKSICEGEVWWESGDDIDEKQLGVELNDVGEDDGDQSVFRSVLLEQCRNLVSLELSAIARNGKGFLSEEEVVSPPKTKIRSLVCQQNLLSEDNTFVRDMLLICPELEEAAFVNCDGLRQDSTFLTVLESTNRLNKLTRLSLDLINEEVIKKLERYKDRLRLKHFKARVLDTSFAESNLLNFLISQSASLESLILPVLTTLLSSSSQYDVAQQQVRSLVFPQCMPILKLLILGLEYPSMKQFGQMDLSSQFPSLTTFIILSAHQDNRDNMNIRNIMGSSRPVPSLKVLELPMYLDPEILGSVLGRLFPNLKHLCIGYQPKDGLRQVWRNCTQLESLFLCAYPSAVIDFEEHFEMDIPDDQPQELFTLEELLTGFDKHQINMALANVEDVGHATFPSISNLTKLQELTIHGGSQRNVFHSGPSLIDFRTIGNLTFIHAISKLSSLQFLCITVENEVLLSQVRKACPDLKLKYEPDRDFLHLEGEHFCGCPHQAFVQHDVKD